MTGLGRILQEARASRGIGLEEAENATRISRRYLEALEQEDFAVFPAPVYARGFLRSYSQFLGLNPADILALFPPPAAPETPQQRQQATRAARPARPMTTTRLPQPSRTPAVLTAGVVIFLAILGVVYVASSIGGGDPEAVANPSPTRTATRTATERPSDTPTGTASPRPSGTPTGTVPEFTALTLDEAIALLEQSGLRNFVLVEVENDAVEPGTVFDQSPLTGTEVDGDVALTLMVSKSAE